MKAFILFSIFFLCLISCDLQGQNNTFYRAKVYVKDCYDYDYGIIKQQCSKLGYLYQVSDTTISLVQFSKGKPTAQKLSEGKYEAIKLSGLQIDKLTLQKNHSILRGPTLGFLGGSVLGFAIGYFSWSPSDAFLDDPAVDGFLGAAIGSTVGTVGGYVIQRIVYKKHIYNINGDKSNFEKHKSTIQKMSLMF